MWRWLLQWAVGDNPAFSLASRALVRGQQEAKHSNSLPPYHFYWKLYPYGNKKHRKEPSLQRPSVLCYCLKTILPHKSVTVLLQLLQAFEKRSSHKNSTVRFYAGITARRLLITCGSDAGMFEAKPSRVWPVQVSHMLGKPQHVGQVEARTQLYYTGLTCYQS